MEEGSLCQTRYRLSVSSMQPPLSSSTVYLYTPEDINSQSSSPSQIHQLPSESPQFRSLVLHPPSPLPEKLLSIPTSATTTQVEPETLINPVPERKIAKMVHKIRVFRGLRNNREDPADFFESSRLCLSPRLQTRRTCRSRCKERISGRDSEDSLSAIIFQGRHDDLEIEEKSDWPNVDQALQDLLSVDSTRHTHQVI